MRESLESMKFRWQAASYPELAQAMLDYKREYDEAKRESTERYQQYLDFIRVIIPERLETDGIEGIFVEVNGVKHRLSTLHQVTVKQKQKEEVFRWLHEIGADALISETVHSSTLAGFVREQIRDGNPIPEEALEVGSYEQASLVKV